ncbi:DUF6440 family protein [Magnetococcus sp. PR-3]|uniref:DUF6440 family protein n=1 Tax=Magnetococcus sp. PR-3 TaxID=3120355 RepID=UPI002FCDECDF
MTTKQSLYGWVSIALFVLGMWWASDRHHDSTDYPGQRSGMEIYVDALTGCHYLTTARGGLTPRVDQQGHNICVEE